MQFATGWCAFSRFLSSDVHIFICSCPGHGMVKTLRSIYREAGVGGLYAGLPVTMLIAVPANVLYFATYESLRDSLQPRIPNSGEQSCRDMSRCPAPGCVSQRHVAVLRNLELYHRAIRGQGKKRLSQIDFEFKKLEFDSFFENALNFFKHKCFTREAFGHLF